MARGHTRGVPHDKSLGKRQAQAVDGTDHWRQGRGVNWVLVVLGFAFAIVGSAILRLQPAQYTKAKVPGLLLLVAGVAILFRERWWMALVGFAAWPVVMGLFGITTRPKR